MMKFHDLPEDILIHIFMSIEPLTLINISKTNKQINNIVDNIVFKKILIVNNKPMSQYSNENRNNFFVYIFDSYTLGSIDNMGIPFNDNAKTYVIVHNSSNYITHNNFNENGKFGFAHIGVATNNYTNTEQKPNPIIIRNFNTMTTYSR